MTVEVGSQAPDFTLKNQDGRRSRSPTSPASRPSLLVFYPFAFSGICTGELCSAARRPVVVPERRRPDPRHLGATPPGRSRPGRTQEGYEFPLLSDFWPHGAVAESYGVFTADLGFAFRGTFLDRHRRRRPLRRAQRPRRRPRPAGLAQTPSRSSRLRPDGLVRVFPLLGHGNARTLRARSSAEEHRPYKPSVAGSNPAAPTQVRALWTPGSSLAWSYTWSRTSSCVAPRPSNRGRGASSGARSNKAPGARELTVVPLPSVG